MYLSHLDAHARSIEELTGERPARGRSMYIETQRHRTGIIDDSQVRHRANRNPLAQRPLTIHWGSLPEDVMAGNYVSGWQQPRDQHAMGQQVIHSANMKIQHQQSYPQQSHPHGGRRPFGRYGSRPSSDSTELVGGQSFRPGGNRAADMFKRAKEHTDKYAIDDEVVSSPRSVQKARAGADEYDLPQPSRRQQARPVARPAAQPVAQSAQPTSPAYGEDYSYAPQQPQKQAPRQQQPQQRQQPTQRAQQAQRNQQAMQPQQSPYASDYGKPTATRSVIPPSNKGPQYDARTRQQRNHQQPVAACSWNKDASTKRFHAGVQPYEDNYNRMAQGWASTYTDTFSNDEGGYDPFAPKAAPNFQAAPKIDVTKSMRSRGQQQNQQDFNKRAKGWKSAGFNEDDRDALFNQGRQPTSTLKSAFEEPRQQQQRPQQRQQQQRQQPRQQQQQQQRRPPQQRMSAGPQYGAGSQPWSGMLESDDL